MKKIAIILTLLIALMGVVSPTPVMAETAGGTEIREAIMELLCEYMPEIAAHLQVDVYYNGELVTENVTLSKDLTFHLEHEVEAGSEGGTYTLKIYLKDFNELIPTDYYSFILDEELNFTLTLNFVCPVNIVTATKVWNDEREHHPTVYFQLMRSYSKLGNIVREAVPGAEIKELADGTTDVSWSGVRKYFFFKPITYSVVEVDAAGNPFVPAAYTKEEKGLTVTNTLRTIDVTAEKEWVDGPDERPDIWFQLVRHVEGHEAEKVGEPVKLASGTLTHVWTKVEEVDDAGEPYVYSVQEVNGSGEDATPLGYVKEEKGLKVINHYEGIKGDVSAFKIWIGGDSKKRPDIQFQLYCNDNAVGEPVTLPGGTLNVIWKDMPLTDKNGNLNTYRVDEVSVPDGFEKSVNGLLVTNQWVGTKPTDPTKPVDPEKPVNPEKPTTPATPKPTKPTLPKTGAGGSILPGLMLLGAGLLLRRK